MLSEMHVQYSFTFVFVPFIGNIHVQVFDWLKIFLKEVIILTFILIVVSRGWISISFCVYLWKPPRTGCEVSHQGKTQDLWVTLFSLCPFYVLHNINTWNIFEFIMEHFSKFSFKSNWYDNINIYLYF